MAEISLKIKSDFEQASADFKKLNITTEQTKKQFEAMQKAMSGEAIDKFIAKNKLNATAITATKGAAAGLEAEYKGLQRQIETLIKKGVDPNSEALNKLKNRFNELGPQVQKGQTAMSGMASSAMTLAKGFVAYQLVDKIKDIGMASLKAAANMEQQTVAFTTMLGSAAKAESLLSSLQEFAASTPFSFNELTEASRKMIAFGFSAQEIIPNMRMLGDVAAGLSQPVGDIAYLFGQVKTQGKAMTQDLNQFTNRGVPIFKELAKVLGISTAEVRKFAEQGKIGFAEIEQVFKNMTGEGGKFGGLMDAQSQTLSGKWSNFGDNLDRIAVTLGQKMAPAAGEVLDLLNVMFESDTSEFERNMSGIIKMQQEIITRRGEGFVDDGKDYYAGELKYLDQIQGIIIPINATSKERLEIYKKIAEVGMEEAKNLGLVQRSHMANLLLLDQHKNKVLEIANAYIKANGGKPVKDGDKPKATGSVGAKKSEDQIFQENLNNMALAQVAFEQQRLNTMTSFYDQRLALQGWMNEEEMNMFVAQETMKIANSKLTDDQKLAAMNAMNKAVQKNAQQQVQTQLQFGSNIIGTTSDMLGNIQTVMKNAGKDSYKLAVLMKGLAIAQAGVNTALAITNALAKSGTPWMGLAMAAVIGAAGAAQIAAIATTPIPSAETGIQNYTVPETRGNRNDGAAVMAQGGEQVTVTPRGEESSQVTSVNISIGETQLFSIIQRGINTGQINVSNKNVGSAVFAR